ANRPELLAEAKAQMELVLRYLPAQMSREEVVAAAEKVVAEVGASGPQAAGEVMKRLMPGLKGKADGKLINEVVRDLLK
ncbi:MAG TPA: GatB/YqeY domain-containing protein, partial [Anaerolineae bacterium]